MITPRRAAVVLIRTGCALIALGLISACSAPTPTPLATATATHFRTWTPIPTLTPSGTPTPSLTPTITPTAPTPTLSVGQMTDQAAVVRVGRLNWTDDTEGIGPPWTFARLGFYSARGGWAWGPSMKNGAWLIGFTRDAGETWMVRRLPPTCNLEAGTQPQVLMRDAAVGWAWCTQLWSTIDGGATWVEEMPGDVILAWGRGASGWLWLLWETPDDGLHLQGLSGPHRADWSDPAVIPSAWTIRNMVDHGYPPISVVDEHTVLVSAVRRESRESHRTEGWWLTVNGGSHWDRVTMPCVSGLIEDQDVALGSDGVIWMNCGGMGAMRGIGKAFWRSNDNGLTWRLIAATQFGYPAGGTSAAILPWAGFPVRLATLSKDFAYTFMVSLNAPGLTHDGGETWHFPRVEPCTEIETISDGVFFDDQYGYVVGTGGVARTSDGGNTWECLLYPERGE